MASQDIRLGVGGFDCDKVQKIIFFANAFSSMPQIDSIPSAIKNLFQRFQITISVGAEKVNFHSAYIHSQSEYDQ
jgi:endonuclease IV